MSSDVENMTYAKRPKVVAERREEGEGRFIHLQACEKLPQKGR